MYYHSFSNCILRWGASLDGRLLFCVSWTTRKVHVLYKRVHVYTVLCVIFNYTAIILFPCKNIFVHKQPDENYSANTVYVQIFNAHNFAESIRTNFHTLCSNTSRRYIRRKISAGKYYRVATYKFSWSFPEFCHQRHYRGSSKSGCACGQPDVHTGLCHWKSWSLVFSSFITLRNCCCLSLRRICSVHSW